MQNFAVTHGRRARRRVCVTSLMTLLMTSLTDDVPVSVRDVIIFFPKKHNVLGVERAYL